MSFEIMLLIYHHGTYTALWGDREILLAGIGYQFVLFFACVDLAKALPGGGENGKQSNSFIYLLLRLPARKKAASG